MPGRIIKSLIKAEASNPVIILDEIDKLSSDRQGDPASAMLEVLDPEQNNSFHDNYIDLDYDCRKSCSLLRQTIWYDSDSVARPYGAD